MTGNNLNTEIYRLACLYLDAARIRSASWDRGLGYRGGYRLDWDDALRLAGASPLERRLLWPALAGGYSDFDGWAQAAVMSPLTGDVEREWPCFTICGAMDRLTTTKHGT